MIREPSISRFPIEKDLDKYPPELKTKMLQIQSKIGFIPNVFLALSYRMKELKGFFEYHDAIMFNENSRITNAEKEMIVVATSGLNNCLYCVVAHGAALRLMDKKPLIADQIAINFKKAEISARQQAMLDFAVRVAKESHLVGEEDFQKLRAHGFQEEDIWDIGSIASFFSLSNRMANLSGMRPNNEFYLMGRVDKKVYEQTLAKSEKSKL